MFIHQTSNSVGNEIYNAFVYRNFNWQAHMHKSFEFVYVYEGELKAMVDGKSYSLHKNECLFVEPYCVHAYEYVRHCTCLIVVFSTSFVELFTRSINKKKAISHKFVLSPSATEYVLTQITDGNTDYSASHRQIKKALTLSTRAALLCICAEFFQSTEFVPYPSRQHSTALDCLMYIENNYTESITLRGMAKALGYSHEYLSRIFHHDLGIGFKTLVNQYRCQYAQELLRSTQHTVAEIALLSGFQSIRSFNRAFKSLTGFSPNDARKRISNEL